MQRNKQNKDMKRLMIAGICAMLTMAVMAQSKVYFTNENLQKANKNLLQ